MDLFFQLFGCVDATLDATIRDWSSQICFPNKRTGNQRREELAKSTANAEGCARFQRHSARLAKPKQLHSPEKSRIPHDARQSGLRGCRPLPLVPPLQYEKHVPSRSPLHALPLERSPKRSRCPIFSRFFESDKSVTVAK